MKLFLIGFMGSGKSYWGRLLSESLALPLLEMDEIITRKTGLSITEIFSRYGEAYFRKLERDTLLECVQNDRFVLSCGGGLPCFYDNMAVMNRHGLTIWLNPPVSVMAERMREEKNERPLLKDIDGRQLEAYIEKMLDERRSFYARAGLVVDPSACSPESFTEKIRSCIKHT